MGLGLPFEGTICFRPETSYTVSTAAGPSWKPSDKVYDAKLDWGNTYKALRGISAPSVCGFISTPSDYTLHVEWVSQSTSVSLASYCVNRTSTGDLTSLAFSIGANVKGSTKSYYALRGAKCKTFSIKAGKGEEMVCSADFSVASVIMGTSTTSTYGATIGTKYAAFNKAGTVVAKNTNVAIATITDSFNVTVNNNLQDYWTASSQYKQAAIPGALDVTGTVDISLDDGGGAFAAVSALYGELTNIYVDQNLTAFGKLTLSSARFDGLTVDMNVSNDIIKTGQKFIAKYARFST